MLSSGDRLASGILPGNSSFTAPTMGTRDGISKPVSNAGSKAITGAGEGSPEMGPEAPGLNRDKENLKQEPAQKMDVAQHVRKLSLGSSCLGGSGWRLKTGF